MCGTRRREDDMDDEASPVVANNELIATVRALESSLHMIQVAQQTMQVDQQHNRQFLETLAAQQEQLHQCAQWSEALQAAHSSAARAASVLRPRQCSVREMHTNCPSSRKRLWRQYNSQ
jgi:hypothetical protein